MKAKETVKTESKAIEILNSWLTSELHESNLSTDTNIISTSIQCECGETLAYKAFKEGGNEIAIVGICECCGDDDNFESDVLHII